MCANVLMQRLEIDMQIDAGLVALVFLETAGNDCPGKAWLVPGEGVSLGGVRRRLLSSAEAAASSCFPLPITIMCAGTVTLMVAVKRLMPYPLTGNQRPDKAGSWCRDRCRPASVLVPGCRRPIRARLRTRTSGWWTLLGQPCVERKRTVESCVTRSAFSGLLAASRTLVTRRALWSSKVATLRSSRAVNFTLARAVSLWFCGSEFGVNLVILDAEAQLVGGPCRATT